MSTQSGGSSIQEYGILEYGFLESSHILETGHKGIRYAGGTRLGDISRITEEYSWLLNHASAERYV